jgi:hypothetical protein
MKNGGTFFLWMLCTQASHAVIQFYVGAMVHYNKTTHSADGDATYWNKYLSNTYSGSLTRVHDIALANSTTNGMLDFAILSGGTPQELFEHLLNDNSSQIFKTKKTPPSVSFTVGAFFYRHQSILFAIEAYVGNVSISEKQKSKMTLLNSSAPSEVEKGDYHQNNGYLVADMALRQLNPKKSALVPYIYIAGKVEAENEIDVTSALRTGILFRSGTILWDRAYVFAILGVDMNACSIKIVEKLPSLEQMLLYACAPSGAGSNTTFYKFFLDPSTPGEHSLKFDQNKKIWGPVFGGGVELFIVRHLSFRIDCVYKHCADVKVKSSEGELLYRSSHCRLCGGVFYRF